MKLYGIIYCITNIINGKKYVGQTTKSLEKRWKNHILSANNPKYIIQRAIRKYGPENFTVTKICESSNKNDLDQKETYYIKYYNTLFENGNGYNLSKGGNAGGLHSDITKKKMSQIQKRILYKTHTKESNEKRSNTLKNRKFSEETIRKMRESAYNLYNSETGNEQRIKISQPGKKNAMYRYTWFVKNIVTGQIDVVENKTEYCKLNNYSLSRMKRIAKNGGIYKHLQIEREEI